MGRGTGLKEILFWIKGQEWVIWLGQWLGHMVGGKCINYSYFWRDCIMWSRTKSIKCLWAHESYLDDLKWRKPLWYFMKAISIQVFKFSIQRRDCFGVNRGVLGGWKLYLIPRTFLFDEGSSGNSILWCILSDRLSHLSTKKDAIVGIYWRCYRWNIAMNLWLWRLDKRRNLHL